MTDEEQGKDPPTREEMIAQLEGLKAQAEELLERSRGKPTSPAVIALRLFLLFGLPIGAGIAVGALTGSVLYAILTAVGGVVLTLWLALRSQGPSRAGTRGWEAEHNARLLSDVIASRRAQLASADGDERGKLEREIAFLEEQRRDELAVAASGDMSPGKGHVGFTAYSGD